MAQPKPIIIVDQLVKTYDGKNVVDSVSFEVKKGEIFGILGPNGAGKTTTLEMLEALRPIDGGTATIDRIDVAKQPKHIKNIIGIQLQSTTFYDKLTLREQLKMFASLYGQTVDADALDEAELLCDRLAIMDNGKIITIDTPHNLIKQLLARGFKKKQVVEQANLEDVFIDLTGKAIRD